MTDAFSSACDAHLHIYDPRFASQSPLEPNASTPQYSVLQKQFGLSRAVIVQPRVYGTDNSATLQAIQDLGRDNTRGIAVVDRDITDAQLAALHDGGIRGVRFSFHSPNKSAGDFDSVMHIAQRIAPYGWHVQLHWTADQIAGQEALLQQLPVPIVFDHMARLPLDASFSHPAFGIVRNLLRSGRAWLKLSGPYLNTAFGVDGGYADATQIAQAWVEAAPEQLVWGSDWPHVTEPANKKPSDTELFELLDLWCGSSAIKQQILVTNPARLYGFSDH